MEKEIVIVSVARDEATKITRVQYADGTFDALTDAEVAERGIVTEVEEGVETTEESNPSEEVSTQDTKGDEGVETIDKSELGFYKLTQPIPYTGEEGNQIGVAEVGSIQEVPKELGDGWVAEEKAVLATEEEIKSLQDHD